MGSLGRQSCEYVGNKSAFWSCWDDPGGQESWFKGSKRAEEGRKHAGTPTKPGRGEQIHSFGLPQLYSMECNAPAARNSDAAWFMVEVGLAPTAPVRTATPAAVGMPMWSASTAPESESPLSESLAQLDADETETWAGPACGGTGMTCGCGCWWCICGACGYACGCATGACGYACGWCATGALLTAGAAERSVGGEGREEGETRSGGGR